MSRSDIVVSRKAPAKKFRHTIRLKLALFVATLVVLTSGILASVGYRFTERVVADQIKDRLTVIASSRQAAILAYVEQQLERADYLANRNRLRSNGPTCAAAVAMPSGSAPN